MSKQSTTSEANPTQLQADLLATFEKPKTEDEPVAAAAAASTKNGEEVKTEEEREPNTAVPLVQKVTSTGDEERKGDAKAPIEE